MTENTPSNAVISEELLSILVCPLDKAEVTLIDNELVCSQCGRHYSIENGIPNMLIEDGD
jgi:uncharacterized protein YbaR (Trm112 family)